MLPRQFYDDLRQLSALQIFSFEFHLKTEKRNPKGKADDSVLFQESPVRRKTIPLHFVLFYFHFSFSFNKLFLLHFVCVFVCHYPMLKIYFSSSTFPRKVFSVQSNEPFSISSFASNYIFLSLLRLLRVFPISVLSCWSMIQFCFQFARFFLCRLVTCSS